MEKSENKSSEENKLLKAFLKYGEVATGDRHLYEREKFEKELLLLFWLLQSDFESTRMEIHHDHHSIIRIGNMINNYASQLGEERTKQIAQLAFEAAKFGESDMLLYRAIKILTIDDCMLPNIHGDDSPRLNRIAIDENGLHDF